MVQIRAAPNIEMEIKFYNFVYQVYLSKLFLSVVYVCTWLCSVVVIAPAL